MSAMKKVVKTREQRGKGGALRVNDWESLPPAGWTIKSSARLRGKWVIGQSCMVRKHKKCDEGTQVSDGDVVGATGSLARIACKVPVDRSELG
jgi:hypothetical protein